MTNLIVGGKKIVSRSYRTWKSMIERCYSKGYQERFPTYLDCYVCKEWQFFSVFDKWYESNYIDGFDLDKDLKVKGNKIYSPDFCIFVPQSVNKLLNECLSKKGKFPTGVSFCKAEGMFQSSVKAKGKRIHLGYFDSPDEARKTYKKEKNKEIMRQARSHKHIAKYLMQHILED